MRGALSFRGFLSSLAARLKLVRYASKLKDKLGFLLWVVLSLQPKTIASRLPQGLRGKRRALLSALFFKLTFKVDGVDYAPLSFDNLGLILPESESWMWRFLKPRKGNVVLDVGAHVGKYALRLSREVGEEGLVIALEPHPETFKALARGAALSPFKNIVPLDVAA
ncbi:TPA: FkbM family methyltransferase [Candidatus Bathyarchaeota archaeon]|nr:FkbM family methyltransferase [Candidatus Bathyarchaeota archaeon]